MAYIHTAVQYAATARGLTMHVSLSHVTPCSSSTPRVWMLDVCVGACSRRTSDGRGPCADEQWLCSVVCGCGDWCGCGGCGSQLRCVGCRVVAGTRGDRALTQLARVIRCACMLAHRAGSQGIATTAATRAAGEAGRHPRHQVRAFVTVHRCCWRRMTLTAGLVRVTCLSRVDVWVSRMLLRRMFRNWRRALVVLRVEHERQSRQQHIWNKVQGWFDDSDL